MDVTKIRNSLHCASPEEAGRKNSFTRRANVAYGRGVLVGLVSGLMAAGMQFDDAWQLCLAQGLPILPDCIPPSWPSASNYQTAAGQWTAEDILRNEG